MGEMVPVLVHAGLPKTGTTTIQATLFENRDRLADAGVFVPVFSSTMPGHRKLSSLWRDDDHGRASVDPAELIGGLRASIEHAKAAGGGVIVSSETLSDPRAKSGAHVLRDMIREAGGDLRVLAYARSPIDHLPSAVQQESKSYSLDYAPLAKRVVMHPRRFENLRTLFGFDAITLRIFDRSALVDGDVIADFVHAARTLDLPLPDLTAAEVANESIGAAACALLLTLRNALEGRELDGRSALFTNVRRALVRFENQQGRGGKLQLPPVWIPVLEEIAREPWNSLLQHAQLTEAERSRLRIRARSEPAEAVKLDRTAWVLSYRDRKYERRFVDFYKAQPRVKLPNLAKLLSKP